MRTPLAATALALGLALASPATAQANSVEGNWKTDDGKSLAVSTDHFARSAHRKLECTDCHAWRILEGGNGPTFGSYGSAQSTQMDAQEAVAQLKAARETLGNDFWSYGVEPNRKTIEAFLHHHHAQGLSCRKVGLDELFHPSTYESYSI